MQAKRVLKNFKLRFAFLGCEEKATYYNHASGPLKNKLIDENAIFPINCGVLC